MTMARRIQVFDSETEYVPDSDAEEELDSEFEHASDSDAEESFTPAKEGAPRQTRTFTPSKGKLDRRMVDDGVRKKLLDPLKESDLESGWVYGFSSSDADDRIKVGYSKGIEIRYENHKRCYEDFKEIWRVYIPNARRFEQIIHAEFAQEHEMTACVRCGKKHKEWFKVDGDRLEASVLAWANFALTTPYAKDGLFDVSPPIIGWSKSPKRWQNWAWEMVGDRPPLLSLQKPIPPKQETPDKTSRSSLSPSPLPSTGPPSRRTRSSLSPSPPSPSQRQPSRRRNVASVTSAFENMSLDQRSPRRSTGKAC